MSLTTLPHYTLATKNYTLDMINTIHQKSYTTDIQLNYTMLIIQITQYILKTYWVIGLYLSYIPKYT